MFRPMINWRVALPLALFFAIMFIVVKPLAFWGAEAHGWMFAIAVIPVIVFIAWLIDWRDRRKAQQSRSQDAALSPDD